MPDTVRRDAITDVDGIRVGHWADRRAATGCTAIVARNGATPGFFNPGGAPGTMDTDLIRAENMIQRVHAVLLTGGSLFGLEAASGVKAHLRQQGIGFRFGANPHPIPIVAGAVVYDLPVGRDSFPRVEAGRLAARRANAGRVAQGSVGVGTGCTVAKTGGLEAALKGGVGTASVSHESGLVVGALVATNSVGDIHDEDGSLIAGSRGRRKGAMRRAAALMQQRTLGEYLEAAEEMRRVARGETSESGANTTLCVVATNAKLDKGACGRMAIMANAGLALTIRPVHTPGDGDSIFTLATGTSEVPVMETPGLLTLLGVMAVEAVSRAVVRSVREAEGLAGIPSVREWTSRSRRR